MPIFFQEHRRGHYSAPTVMAGKHRGDGSGAAFRRVVPSTLAASSREIAFSFRGNGAAPRDPHAPRIAASAGAGASFRPRLVPLSHRPRQDRRRRRLRSCHLLNQHRSGPPRIPTDDETAKAAFHLVPRNRARKPAGPDGKSRVNKPRPVCSLPALAQCLPEGWSGGDLVRRCDFRQE
ncbi:hypothetical protein F2981_33265 (plasmid) [Sinorhizobium meliloti]|nr:hypothetical protein [Sinorhizobium meliloti]